MFDMSSITNKKNIFVGGFHGFSDASMVRDYGNPAKTLESQYAKKHKNTTYMYPAPQTTHI